MLYLALDYGTATHTCCCGCGEEVVTPLTPTDWRITYDGETISLSPSVGNWNAACRSHYIVERGRVIPCGDWSDERIAAERQRDCGTKARYYSELAQGPVEADDGRAPIPSQQEIGRPERLTPLTRWREIARRLFTHSRQ
ncbi:hypothetical protein MASR1M101_12570 [Gemmatimonas sp.]